MSRPIATLAMLLLSLVALAAPAQTRAWLDRDRVALGETVTLNIETDDANVASPDYSPLLGEFGVSGNTSSRQFESINGASHARVLFAVALQPKREGVIGIPRLLVGSQRTQPLSLSVTAPAATPARAGGAVFIESEADAQEPYVQQAVGYTVRLYYATPLVSGQLDQDEPEGASLQRVGEDAQYAREIAGHRYTVVERHYLLIPERSGTLTIPGARFQGRGVSGGFFEDMFGDGQRDLRATSAPRFLKVRAAPADAPQPWLPLRALTLRYLATPQRARAGEAVTVTVEASADGATAAQMPELQLPVGDGAQVFADPAQSDETFASGRPQVKVTRSFSIVPGQAGSLLVGGPRMAWWDVRAGVARTASLPDLRIEVVPGSNGFGAAPAATANAGSVPSGEGIRVPGVQGAVRPWALAAVVFAALWLVTFAWGLHRRAQPATPQTAIVPAPGRAGAGRSQSQLKRALEHGDFDEIAQALCAMASPAVAELDELRGQLADPQQVAAIDALQRARWGDGDGTAARIALRAAFRRGPRWRQADVVSQAPLPPLYPAD